MKAWMAGAAVAVVTGGLAWALVGTVSVDDDPPAPRLTRKASAPKTATKAAPAKEGVAKFLPSALPDAPKTPKTIAEAVAAAMAEDAEAEDTDVGPEIPEGQVHWRVKPPVVDRSDDGRIRVDQRKVRKPDPNYKRLGEDGGPLTVGKVGAELLFERRKDAVDQCVKWTAPAALPGEDRIAVSLTVGATANGSAGVLKEIAVVDEGADARHGNFVPCLAEALKGEPWHAPADGEDVTITWAVFR